MYFFLLIAALISDMFDRLFKRGDYAPGHENKSNGSDSDSYLSSGSGDTYYGAIGDTYYGGSGSEEDDDDLEVFGGAGHYGSREFGSGSDFGTGGIFGSGNDYGSTGDSGWDNPFMDHSRPSIPSADWTFFGGSDGGSNDPFSTNDSMRAHMEDMQQFASGDSSFNPYDHGYDWDEISDAENDGFFD